ncbi:MAG: hypothetical protein H0X14_06760 [Acidobacteria bacterium]|nr:hypothetical protein [Acidobacteriota bacterium]
MKALKKVLVIVSLMLVMSMGAQAALAGVSETPGARLCGTGETPGVTRSGVGESPGFIEAILFMATLVM